jgi:hypothetical protein
MNVFSLLKKNVIGMTFVADPKKPVGGHVLVNDMLIGF